LFGRPDQFDGIGQQRALISGRISDQYSLVVDAQQNVFLPQQPAHDPSVAEESTNGDVFADNVDDDFVVMAHYAESPAARRATKRPVVREETDG